LLLEKKSDGAPDNEFLIQVAKGWKNSQVSEEQDKFNNFVEDWMKIYNYVSKAGQIDDFQGILDGKTGHFYTMDPGALLTDKTDVQLGIFDDDSSDTKAILSNLDIEKTWQRPRPFFGGGF